MMFCHEAVFVGFTPLAGDAILDIGTVHIGFSMMFRHEAVLVFFTRWPAMQLLTCSRSSRAGRRRNC